MTKILVTPRSITSVGGRPALERLRWAGYEVVLSPAGQLPNANQLKELLPGCVGYLAGVEKISADALRAADQLRVISRDGPGVDSIDLDWASKRGISVCQAGGGKARGVAELALGLLIALVRHFDLSNAAVKHEAWERRKGYKLKDKCLGLVVCGNVGRLVARIAVCLDMDVLAYDLQQDASFSIGERFRWVDFDYLLRRADLGSLHCPPQPGWHAAHRCERLKKDEKWRADSKYGPLRALGPRRCPCSAWHGSRGRFGSGCLCGGTSLARSARTPSPMSSPRPTSAGIPRKVSTAPSTWQSATFSRNWRTNDTLHVLNTFANGRDIPITK